MSTGTDRYTRLHRVATGGMGEVWRAHDEVLHRDVAVKYLKREYADDEGARTRFLHEARNAASLQHPGIATVFDFGESEVEDGLPFLVMEYVEGRPLSELLAQGALGADRSRELVRQAAEALAVAHAAGLVHRDVKPANLLVTDDDTVKITDFGIARAGDGLALTQTGQVLGTPSYLSPEQAEGQAATAASDVYALGVVLFECLAGHKPFTADTPVAVALAHVREPVPDLPEDVPEDLDTATRRALAKHPEDRYPDAAAFADALRLPAADQTLMLTAPVPAVPTGGGPLARLGIRREHRPALVAAVVVLLFVVVLVVAALSPDGGTTSDTPRSGSSSPTVTTSPTTVSVDRALYVGKPVADVKAALAGLGLQTKVSTVANTGGHAANTVKDLGPTGAVAPNATITLDVWGPVPKPAPKPSPKPGSKHHKGKGKHR